jgi:hypothetical protein
MDNMDISFEEYEDADIDDVEDELDIEPENDGEEEYNDDKDYEY